MADTPEPKSRTSISSELRAVRATLNDIQVVAQKLPPLPPPIAHHHTPTRPSTFAKDAGRWTPAGVALLISAVVPLVSIWKVNAEIEKNLKEAIELNKTQDAKIKDLQKKLGNLSKRYSKFRSNEVDYRAFSDAAFCELGAKPSHGCPPGVEYHPRPLNKKVQPIQPRVRTLPLLPEEVEDADEE